MSPPIKRLFKTISNTLTFQAHEKGNQLLLDNPEVVIRIYKNIISKKRENLILFKKGVKRLTQLIEKKKNIHRLQSEDINNIEKMKTRVINDQSNISSELQNKGKSEKDIKQHPDYTRCIKAKDNFNKILEIKYNRLAILNEDIEMGQKDLDTHKHNLACLQKELDQLKQELSESESDRFFFFQQKEFRKIKSRNHEGQLANEQSVMSYEQIKEHIQESLKDITAIEISSNKDLGRLEEIMEKVHRKYLD